jgi:hypothetical protein
VLNGKFISQGWDNAINEDDPDQRVQFCEWLQHKIHEDEELLSKIVWSDEAIFKLNGGVNHHNCVYWAAESPLIHVNSVVSLSGLTVWCGLFLIEGTVTGHKYGKKPFYFHQDGALPHYH